MSQDFEFWYKAFSPAMIMFSRLRPPLGLDFERLEPAAVKGHARSVHRAQRDLLRQSQAASFRFRAAALSGCAGAARAAFPSQRFLQLPDLAFRAFYHLFPPNQMVKRIIPGIEGKTPAMTDTQHRSSFNSIRYGSGITSGEAAECKAYDPLIDLAEKAPDALIADNAYDADAIRDLQIYD
jgi:hypothetical protein